MVQCREVDRFMGNSMKILSRSLSRCGLVSIILLLAIVVADAAGRLPVKPSRGDKCPVCGMFVAKYPDFAAQVLYKDGSYAVFDGAKDLFKYLQNQKKYAPAKGGEAAIDAIFVTDYYTLSPVAAKTAWFVVGSDVLGPMGRELIPFGKEVDAKEFKKDHKGNRIIRFAEVTPAVLMTLD